MKMGEGQRSKRAQETEKKVRTACECESCRAWVETQKDRGRERWRRKVRGELMKMEEGRGGEDGL